MKMKVFKRLNMSVGYRKPDWFKVPLSDRFGAEVKRLLADLQLHTVCREAHCPNIGECFNRGTATFLILGEVCTRNCRFCAIQSGKPEAPDPEEPNRIAQAVKRLNLTHCVITGVNRDDLPRGGADYYAETVEKVKGLNPKTSVEVLPGDFDGSGEALKIVLDSNPDVFNHNLETVRRLTPLARDRRADYDISLNLLRMAKELRPDIKTKSGLLVGLGETTDEIIEAMYDLREVKCDGITLGQYIPPSSEHHPVEKYYTPEEFADFAGIARQLNFSGIASGPLVRSSYHAGDFFKTADKLVK